MSRNYNSYNFGLTAKFGLPARPYGIFNLAFQFSIIQPSGFGLTAPPQEKECNFRETKAPLLFSATFGMKT